MKTIDIHTHLLSPKVKFERLYDKITVRFFAKKLGVDPVRLMQQPFPTYVKAMSQSIRESQAVERACLFGVDSRVDKKGGEIHRDNTVCAHTDDVLRVAEENPGCYIPFLSVNPNRPDALDRIDEYVERGCFGAKFLQNYWGVDLGDHRYIPYYEKLKALQIPLIIHVGSEYSIDSFSEYESCNMLDLPLKCGVTVIAAHMGLGRILHKVRFWRNFSKQPKYFDKDYFLLIEKLKEYPNLYADISAILAPLRARALRHLSEQTDIHEKILFGTDYPVPFAVKINSYDLSRRSRANIQTIANPFDRYVAAVLEYFPEESPIYRNYEKVLPLKSQEGLI